MLVNEAFYCVALPAPSKVEFCSVALCGSLALTTTSSYFECLEPRHGRQRSTGIIKHLFFGTSTFQTSLVRARHITASSSAFPNQLAPNTTSLHRFFSIQVLHQLQTTSWGSSVVSNVLGEAARSTRSRSKGQSGRLDKDLGQLGRRTNRTKLPKRVLSDEGNQRRW